MSSFSYDEAFSNFLGNVTDDSFARMSEDNATILLSEYLHKALSDPYVVSLFTSLKFNDEEKTVEYELEHEYINDDGFVVNVVGKSMVCAWLSPQVRSTTLLSQAFLGKESKFFSQSSHLSELSKLYKDTQNEMRKLISDRDFMVNDYIRKKR